MQCELRTATNLRLPDEEAGDVAEALEEHLQAALHAIHGPCPEYTLSLRSADSRASSPLRHYLLRNKDTPTPQLHSLLHSFSTAGQTCHVRASTQSGLT